jgi:hypothetical protein
MGGGGSGAADGRLTGSCGGNSRNAGIGDGWHIARA